MDLRSLFPNFAIETVGEEVKRFREREGSIQERFPKHDRNGRDLNGKKILLR